MAEIDIENKLLYHSQVLKDLASVFVPHEGQIPIGKAIFHDEKKRIFVQCGRKFGKTEITLYCLYRWAMLYPKSYCYYFAPYQDQLKDLIWSNHRMPGFLPPKLMEKYGVSVNNQDKRITFRNGSFIRCDGADNHQKGRGYSATGLVVYDETKDINPLFHEGFEPNLGITDAPLLMIGTPPDASEEGYDRWVKWSDEVKNSPVGFFINRPSMTNPHVSADYFIRKEKELTEKGERWKWEKEYLAQLVKAAGNNIFPMLDKEKHVRSYESMMEIIGIFPKQWDFYGGFDPGSAKCFAFLAVAINRYSKQIFIMDDIYATKMADCRVDNIIPKAVKIEREIMPHHDSWYNVYDYAATWFSNEAQSPEYIDTITLHPCTKDLKNKENKLSLIKEILLKPGLLYISDRVVRPDSGLYWEMEKYATDDKGKIPKENDHAIDTLRYILNAANYYSVEDGLPETETEKFPDRRGFKLDNDYSMLDEGDLYGNIDSDLFYS